MFYVRKYKRQLNILLLYHFKIVSVSTEKMKTVLAASLKNIFPKESSKQAG